MTKCFKVVLVYIKSYDIYVAIWFPSINSTVFIANYYDSGNKMPCHIFFQCDGKVTQTDAVIVINKSINLKLVLLLS